MENSCNSKNNSNNSVGSLGIDTYKGCNLELCLQQVYEQMDLKQVSTSEQRVKKVLEGLGFSEMMMSQPTNVLSGGWVMRASLASAIYNNPDLLLLDEVYIYIYVCICVIVLYDSI